MRRMLERAALALVTAAICSLTLWPVRGALDAPLISVEITGFRGLADAVVNVLLFVPFGLLGARVWPGSRAVGAGLALSVGIELLQLWVPGRYTSPSDVVFNTLGAAVGVWLMRTSRAWLFPTPLLSRMLASAFLATALLVLGGGPFLFRPAVTQEPLYGQWTHDPLGAERYGGTLLDTYVGDMPVHDGRIQRDGELRRRLLDGAPIRLRLLAGPPPADFAPIFSVFDSRARGMLLLGARGTDAVLKLRMRADLLRLDQPDVRFPNALAHARTGAHLEMRVWRDRRGYCYAIEGFAVDGVADDGLTSGEALCGFGFTVGQTWSLLMYPLPAALATILPVVWIAALVLPAGFWLRASPRLLAAAIGLAVVVLAAAAPAAGVLPTPPAQLTAAAFGLLVGYAAGAALERHADARRPVRAPGLLPS